MISPFTSYLLTLATATVPWSGRTPARPVPEDTLRMRVAWEVTEGRHPSADSLGELSGLAVDAKGNVYVTDLSSMKVWVFDRTGRLVGAIGRKGRGPGEFEAPTGPVVTPDGSLYVRDVGRITRFVLDSTTGLLGRYAESFAGPTMADWRSFLATRFDTAGHLYVPRFNVIDRSQRSGYFLQYTVAGLLIDSIEVPAYSNAPKSTAFVRLGANGGRTLQGLNHVPFAALPTWDITPRGTLISGSGQSYSLKEETPEGVEVRLYHGAGAPTRIPTKERAESVAALRARLDSAPVSLDRVEGMPPEVRTLTLPTVFPAYMAAYAASDGLLWVRRWTPDGSERTIFEVFGPDGRLVSVVVLPGIIAILPPPVLSLSAVTAVCIDPETGAQGVRRFHMSP